MFCCHLVNSVVPVYSYTMSRIILYFFNHLTVSSTFSFYIFTVSPVSVLVKTLVQPLLDYCIMYVIEITYHEVFKATKQPMKLLNTAFLNESWI